MNIYNSINGCFMHCFFEMAIIHLKRDGMAACLIITVPGEYEMCPGPELNRHSRCQPRDFKSLVSTFSTTRAVRSKACRNYIFRGKTQGFIKIPAI
jgi:hypothetical protein